MSQHDLNIANQGFPAFRADLNDALVALGSTNSGATAPTTPYANQLWYDTANNILKIRNEDNDAWISLLTLDQVADAVSAIGSISLSSISDVITNAVTLSGSQTLTNKTLTNPVINGFTGNTAVVNIGSGQFYKDTSGNIGIGTATPTRILDIAAPNAGGGNGLRVTATTGTNGALMQVSNTGGNLYYAIDTSGGGTFGLGYSANIWYDGNYPMRFATNNQTQMAITGAGLFQMNSGFGSVATAYGCRAWVNFNGTGTVAIRASGNVSSITDNGTGSYTANFTNAMPDANSCVQVSTNTNVTNADVSNNIASIGATTTNVVHIEGAIATDTPTVCIAVFR
jgi:hypothetical protein